MSLERVIGYLSFAVYLSSNSTIYRRHGPIGHRLSQGTTLQPKDLVRLKSNGDISSLTSAGGGFNLGISKISLIDRLIFPGYLGF